MTSTVSFEFLLLVFRFCRKESNFELSTRELGTPSCAFGALTKWWLGGTKCTLWSAFGAADAPRGTATAMMRGRDGESVWDPRRLFVGMMSE